MLKALNLSDDLIEPSSRKKRSHRNFVGGTYFKPNRYSQSLVIDTKIDNINIYAQYSVGSDPPTKHEKTSLSSQHNNTMKSSTKKGAPFEDSDPSQMEGG